MEKQKIDIEELLSTMKEAKTNLEKGTNYEYNFDNCSCMGCKCFKSAWTLVLSPAGIAAGMAAYAAAVAL